jgi:hypothetical protein
MVVRAISGPRAPTGVGAMDGTTGSRGDLVWRVGV